MNELRHSGHDVDRLVERWQKLAERRNWRVTTLMEIDERPVLAIETGDPGESAIYLSAGIHGDECAPIWGLLEWAETSELSRSCVIFPCLNPHGVVENTRRDQNGVDLNRSFQRDNVELISVWKQFLGDRRFDISINLHEDYDVTGIYLYELARERSVGHRLLDLCETSIPREPAPEVEGREFDRGLMAAAGGEVSKVLREDLDGEWPEAIYLFLEHDAHAFTFETPSEMGLALRIATHRQFVEAALAVTEKE